MAENYFVESRKHIKVMLTIMESMLRNGKATREEYRDIFSHWHKWLNEANKTFFDGLYADRETLFVDSL